jgi:hypothetical protein
MKHALVAFLLTPLMSALSLGSAVASSLGGVLVLECEVDEVGLPHELSPTRLTEHLVIDFSAKRYCTDECREWRPLKSIEANRIVLRDFVDARDPEKLLVDKFKGGYTYRSYSGAAIRSRTGQCRRIDPR